MRLIVLFVALFLLPQAVLSSPSLEDFLAMSVAEQLRELEDVGYQEGGEVGDFSAMQTYAEALHKKYSNTDLSKLSEVELQLLKQVVLTDSTIEYATGDKEVMFRGCRMGVSLSQYLPLQDAKLATIGCNEKLKDLSPEEAQEIVEMAMRSDEIVNRRATETNDPKKNFYLADSGRYLCAAKIDCEEGSNRMYEALLAEYVDKGVDGFDQDLAGDIFSILINHLGDTQNIYALTTTYELQYQLYKAGFIKQDLSHLNNLVESYKQEMKPGDKHIEEVIAILESGRSPLAIEAERYRREHGLPEPVKDTYAQSEPYAEPEVVVEEVAQDEPYSEPEAVVTEAPKADAPKPVAASEGEDVSLTVLIAGGVGLVALIGWFALRRKKR